MTLPAFTTGPVKFKEKPPVGHIHVYRDQVYFLVESSAEKTSLPLTWKSHCCDCGVAFTITSPAKGARGFSRRCAPHRQLGKKVQQWLVHKNALGYHDEDLEGEERWVSPDEQAKMEAKTYDPPTLKEKIRGRSANAAKEKPENPMAAAAPTGIETRRVPADWKWYTARNYVPAVGRETVSSGIVTEAMRSMIERQYKENNTEYFYEEIMSENKGKDELW